MCGIGLGLVFCSTKHNTNMISFKNDHISVSLQEKSLLMSTFVDAKTKKLLQKTFYASTFWLTHNDAINRVT